MLRRTGFVLVLLAVIALLAFTVAPAMAHHKDGHENGPPEDRETSSQGQEDDDGIDDDNDDNEHPSGQDRETNDGPTDDVQGGDQTSNPDNDGHGPERNSCKDTSEDVVGGCDDKPGGTGGVDDEDQDWNNGCGNDDDFEDDNEGLCGGKEKPAPPVTVEGDVEEKEQKDEDDVLGNVINRGQPKDKDEVLGNVVAAAPVTRAAGAVAGAVLPFTGAGVVPLVLIALALMGTGWIVTRKTA